MLKDSGLPGILTIGTSWSRSGGAQVKTKDLRPRWRPKT